MLTWWLKFLRRTPSPDTGTGEPADCSQNLLTTMKNQTRGESPLSATPCCASWIQGPPNAIGGSYAMIYDNGNSSVDWEWSGANAHCVVAHLPIPPKPPLDYNPRAYRDCDDRGWVGKYSWHNGRAMSPDGGH